MFVLHALTHVLHDKDLGNFFHQAKNGQYMKKIKIKFKLEVTKNKK